MSRGRPLQRVKSDLSWIGPLRHDNRAALADEKRRVRPAKSETTADGDQEASGHALESRLAERLGHGEAGMESEEGTAFEYLPRREPCGERTLST